ncbi:MAG: alpha-D-ribose 1-methylphosphonate 5-phosphate C-P-lyase PhnJ [Chloroflexota bacterium]
MPDVASLTALHGEAVNGYSFAFLDDVSKREIRRSLLKAVALPGYQVPFGSRELPIARGWGTGGLQITLSIIGPADTVKVIDQGDDASVNASNLRRLIQRTTGVATTTDTREASLIQTRHRVPEERLTDQQILVLQCPTPEPLTAVEPSTRLARRMHAESDYSRMWVSIYEGVVRRGELKGGAGYPVMVNGRYIMSPTPIPRWDIPRLNNADCLYLFGAGREKRIYAVPPHTRVEPLEFQDYRFEREDFSKRACACGKLRGNVAFFDETIGADGSRRYTCSDTAYCEKVRSGVEVATW